MVRAIILSGEYMSFIFMQNMSMMRRDADPLMRYRNIILALLASLARRLGSFSSR